ncbi:hypothetical protein J5N97_020596 [Dioscorea zingiberensis]|uniref:PNO1 second type I KH domain-containing protein n=1 Tax=Dioscorea zingiberensis TaxID=325984 RepID=A0A9D5CG44_9LILI|nr:hypothetical protein J5N97_020596 [Dioscorea zingiberensis]
MADQVGGASSMDVEVHRAEAAPARPQFAALKPHEMSEGKVQFRKVPVPPHRFSPLKRCWLEIYTPVYEQMKIDIRMNLKTRSDTPDVSNLQKCADFVHAFMLGFDVADALALLRLDDLYVDSFEIKDVKMLRGEHLSRAIGRLSGKGGKTKFAIENSTRTRIVIHLRYKNSYPWIICQHQGGALLHLPRPSLDPPSLVPTPHASCRALRWRLRQRPVQLVHDRGLANELLPGPAELPTSLAAQLAAGQKLRPGSPFSGGATTAAAATRAGSAIRQRY